MWHIVIESWIEAGLPFISSSILWKFQNSDSGVMIVIRTLWCAWKQILKELRCFEKFSRSLRLRWLLALVRVDKPGKILDRNPAALRGHRLGTVRGRHQGNSWRWTKGKILGIQLDRRSAVEISSPKPFQALQKEEQIDSWGNNQ